MTRSGRPNSGRALSRLSIGVSAVAAVVLLGGCGAPGSTGTDTKESGAAAQLAPVKPTKPIPITVLDGAGNLVGTKPLFKQFAKDNPDLISEIHFETAAAPDVAGKVKAQQLAGVPSTSIVLGGPDILGAALSQKLVLQLLPEYKKDLIDLADVQDTSRAALQSLADGYGVLVRYNPSGPILATNPADVPSPPKTPAELLAWAKANPGKFTYAQPANSGPGRTFMMSLPYLLGDKDPKDPKNGWTKTWAYLAELGKYIKTYPASSTIASQQFGSGQLRITPTIISIDMNNRQNGTWAPDTAASIFDNQTWVADGHYFMVPKGATAQTLYVDLKLASYLLDPAQQVKTFGSGTLTSANKNAKVDQATADAKALIKKYGRPDFYPTAFETGKTVTPLDPAKLQEAFDIWQREIGSKVGG
jgi:putative spermidine/putrescine transport system substrate-binding protein